MDLGSNWGAQEAYFPHQLEGVESVRLIWDQLRPQEGFLVAVDRPGDASILYVLHTMEDALHILGQRVDLPVEKLLVSAGDAHRMPLEDFPGMVEEASRSFILTRWSELEAEAPAA